MQNTPPTDYSKATRNCDLVMEGGLTSGVVYPLAVCRLARTFRFKNIGGASAGAIAAAATAAAEFGRGSAHGGFSKLEKLPRELSDPSPDGKPTRLFSLFQAQRRTYAVYATAAAALGGGWGAMARVIARALLAFPIAALVGGLPGIALLVATIRWANGGLQTMLVVYSVCLLVVGIALAVASTFIWRAFTGLPKNYYGLCNGMAGKGARKDESLTPWLNGYLNELAGRPQGGAPLTFGDLWGTSPVKGERQINLEMMTTCLSLGRPFRMPFRDDEDVSENRMFYFRETEFRDFFPTSVVDWMKANPRALDPKASAESKARRERMAARGLYPLPEPKDLPVIVAVRMSLSFPILLSTVPLHVINYGTKNEEPERCWFSDGGISSNFPVHFFDCPVPRWPTFAIQLGIADAKKRPGLWMPKNNGDGMHPTWRRFDSGSPLKQVGGLLGSMISAAKNWGDNTQSLLPGFRDRIGHVNIPAKYGGLNLNMPEPRIKDLSDWGADAGEELERRFSADPPSEVKLNWSNHRWIRLRGSLAAMEEILQKLDAAVQDPRFGDQRYDRWLDASAQAPVPSYPWNNLKQWELACDTLTSLVMASQIRQAAERHGAEPLSNGAPKPRPELRVRMRI